ncbi:MAG: GDP-L-fucose synthase family protein [Chitinophagaceae bacterium]
MNKSDKIYIAGHRGMVGSALLRKLKQEGFSNFLLRNSLELDLRDQGATQTFFREQKPDFVFLAAARVGGILANNTYRADFIYDNLQIQNNVIHSAHLFGVRKLLFLGSSCIYPKLAPQPMKEEYLLTGLLEPTNEPYAIAKIAGIKMCDAYRAQYGSPFISVMPTNLYGPNDHYDLHQSHVLPALIRKFHEATLSKSPTVIVWGTGTPKREFLHADDMADACVHLMKEFDEPGFVNIGTGQDISIADLANLIASITGFQGKIEFDLSKPDGTPRKLLDVSRLHQSGWHHQIGLREGITGVYQQKYF